MRMKVKTLDVDAGGKQISVINEKDALEIGVHPLDKIVLRKGRRRATVTVDTSKNFIKPGTIMLFRDVKESMRLRDGDVVHAEPRSHLDVEKYIRKKTDGKELAYKEIDGIVKDVVSRNLNDLEMASFITALYIRGMTLDESTHMSKAMLSTGKKLKFRGTVVDKHSVGGVPGDKTSMLVVPIIAAAGLVIPKTSSRSITSPAGTADRMEMLAPVTLDAKEISRTVKKTGGCLVWGGSVDLAPADDLFIRIEHPLGLDPLLLPSVMSKKKSVDCKHLVIDIPTGSGAKMGTREESEKLAADFITLGKKLGINVDCTLTRGREPVGYAIGPALEAREALLNLMCVSRSDVFEKATSIAGILLKMTRKGDRETACKIVNSGKAEDKMREIIAAQGGNKKVLPEDIKVGPFMFPVKSRASGVVSGIDNNAIVDICRAAGTPKDKGSGIVLSKKIGDKVRRGDVLFTIYSEKRKKLRTSVKIASKYSVYTLLSGRGKMLLEVI